MRVAFDLDGVLADVHLYAEEYIVRRKDWDTYFSKTLEFPPIAPMVSLARSLIGDGQHVVAMVTGRPESNRELTERWLWRHLVCRHGGISLIMRPNGDLRKTCDLKVDLLKDFRPDLVFEDDPEAVQTLSKAGYLVVQIFGFRHTRSDSVPPI